MFSISPFFVFLYFCPQLKSCIMKFRSFFTNIYVKNLLIAFAILAVLIFLVLRWLDIYTNHGNQVAVPDVVGLQVAEAAPFFRQRTLSYVVIDSSFVKNRPSGSILETIPPVGTNVKEGRTIYVTVNSYSAHLLVVPEVKNMSQRQASAMLKSLGFESVTITMVPAAYRDLVLGLETRKKTLSAGDRLPADTPLTLLVSSGDGEILFSDDDSLLMDNDYSSEPY
jgi:beta-lactam-binding protein with PASTA domain